MLHFITQLVILFIAFLSFTAACYVLLCHFIHYATLSARYTGQRFAAFISVAYQSTGCNNFCSPACRFGLRQVFIYLPHLRVALFKVLPRVVHFACAILKRYKFSLFGTSSISTKVASALISLHYIPCFLLPPLAPLAAARKHIVRKPFRCTSLFAANFSDVCSRLYNHLRSKHCYY